MKRTETGQPELSFAIIARNAAETLEPCLKSLRERAPDAEIVIVDTMSDDGGKTEGIAQRYADVWEEYTGPNGTWTREMYAFDDAAAARNRSFELCSGKWICWVDADDVIPAASEAERLLKLNARWRPGRKALDQEQADRGPVSLTEFLATLPADVEGFKAPYLYRANPDGTAITWQERERIVRNNGKWHWQRPAHEILVPKDVKDYAKMPALSHFLFVHKKKFTNEDTLYSLRRHFDILIKEYDSGIRHPQGLLYLENFSLWLCPQRRPEFIKAAYEASTLGVDRARALIRAGNFAVEQGFYWDAIEAFSGATAIAADFPDGWVAGAHAFEKCDNFFKAAEWFERAVGCPADCSVSDVNPRSQAIEMRMRAALNHFKHGQRLNKGGLIKEAGLTLERAVRLAHEAAAHPAIGDDRLEAICYANLFQNELDSIRAMVGLKLTHEFLVKNDETEKAIKILDVIPHNAKDHPYAIGIERWAKQVQKHLTDDEAYRKFYDEIGTDIVSHEGGLTPKDCLERVKFAISELSKIPGPIEVLEVGSFDGITAIPVLIACPHVSYHAVETKADALARLVERAKKFGVADRLTTTHALLADQGPSADRYDAVIFYEVIEHVPSVSEALRNLAERLKPAGRLFLSTPWGAFDRGFPPFADRDPRGHVRAMTVREIVEACDAVDLRVEELGGNHMNANYGDTIHLMARPTLEPSRGASFVVASALWDWNATHVEQTGIGASEETIVYLARRLGLSGRRAEVFGPLPTVDALALEEVRDGVRYWPREQLRHLDPINPAVISRAPGFGAQIDHDHKILWLQDAYYPDLNAEVAAQYSKIVVLTEWHKQVMHVNHGAPLSKLVIAENFLLPEHFSGFIPARNRHRFIYASSPDRGLVTLLKLWPKIRAAIPDAELHIFYGWEGCMKLGANADPSWTGRYRKIRTQYLALKFQEGIFEHGRVNHANLAREFQQSGAWLYPTSFDETGCLTAAKSLAAGCVPVCTPRAALNETAKSPITRYVPMPGSMDPFCDGVGVEAHPEWEAYAQSFVRAVVDSTHVNDSERALASSEALTHFGLDNIWPVWREILGL